MRTVLDRGTFWNHREGTLTHLPVPRAWAGDPSLFENRAVSTAPSLVTKTNSSDTVSVSVAWIILEVVVPVRVVPILGEILAVRRVRGASG